MAKFIPYFNQVIHPIGPSTVGLPAFHFHVCTCPAFKKHVDPQVSNNPFKIPANILIDPLKQFFFKLRDPMRSYDYPAGIPILYHYKKASKKHRQKSKKTI